MAMEIVKLEKLDSLRETPRKNLHDHIIILPDDSEFYFPFQRESVLSQGRRVGDEGHLGGRDLVRPDECLNSLLGKLEEEEIPGQEYFEEYLRYQYRRNLRPSTMRNSFLTISVFLRLVKAWGKDDL